MRCEGERECARDTSFVVCDLALVGNMLANRGLTPKRNPKHVVFPVIMLTDARPGHIRHLRCAYQPLGGVIGSVTYAKTFSTGALMLMLLFSFGMA